MAQSKSVTNIQYIIVGTIIALGMINIFHLSAQPVSYQLFSLFLAFTACVYLGSAFADKRLKIISLEAVMSIFFFVFSCFGLLYSPIWLILGYSLHATWDLLHHTHIVKTKVIKWFPPICAVFDFVVAGYIFVTY